MIQDVVLAAFSVQDELAHGDDLVPFLEEIFQDGGEGLRGVEGGVVEEDDGAGADLGGHPLGDGGRVVVLPVQAVPTGSGCKAPERKGSEQEGLLRYWSKRLPFYRRGLMNQLHWHGRQLVARRRIRIGFVNMDLYERRRTKKLISKGFHLFQVGVEGVERPLIRRPFRRGGGGIGRLSYAQPHEAGCGSLLRTAAGHLILDAFWQLAADTFNETDGALLRRLVVKAEAIGNVGIV